MSDKDFVVKNGLVVNTTFTANSTEVHVGNTTVNAVFTSPTTNTLTLTLSNTTVTGTLTSANYTGTSANSTLLNNQNGAYYRNATNINAGTLAWAYQASNTVNTTGNFTMTGNLNLTAANNYFGNDIVTPTVFFNTINSTSNGTTVNSSIISLGNSTVNVTINSTGFSGAANNSTYLNGQLASYYRNATNINAGTLAWAYAPVNTVNTTGNFTMAALTVNPTFIVTNGTVSTTSNSSGLYAPSGNVKTSYLETSGLANLAWANITGNTYVGGNLTVAGYLTVVGTATVVNSVSISTKDHNLILASDSISAAAADGSGIKVANLTAGVINYEFASLTYRAADDTWNSNQDFAPSVDATLDLGTSAKKWNSVYATTLYGTLASAQPGITVGDSQKLGGVAAASYVQNTDTRVLSGNLNFTGANTFFGNASVQGTAYFGNSTITNTVVNTAAVTLGGTGTTVGNVSLSYSGFIAGNTTVTSNSVVWVSNTAGSTKIGANGAAIGGNAFQVGTTVYVTTTGNTGHGTSSPAAYVEIDNPFGTSSSNTLFLYQNLASGATSATWNSYRFITTDSADRSSYQFRQFNVGPSGVGIGTAPPTAAKALSDALYVAGNTGFNTITPRALVDINGDLITTTGANIGGALTVSGDTSASNGLTNQILTATGTGTFAPYWSSNAILNTANVTYLNANTLSAIIPPSTYTFSGNATALTGNVKVSTTTANTIVAAAATGTITIASGTQSVTGSGTLFKQLALGTVITLDPAAVPPVWYTVKTITSDTSMTLVQSVPGGAVSSTWYTGGLDNRSRLYVPGIAGLLNTGDALTYTIGAGNTAITGLTATQTYYSIWVNSTSLALSSTQDGLNPVSIVGVSATAQPGHLLTINYNSSVRVGNNAAGAGVIVIGNSTVNSTINSTSFSGSANNITNFPLNQSVNTTSTPTFSGSIFTGPVDIYTTGSPSTGTLYFGNGAGIAKTLTLSGGGFTFNAPLTVTTGPLVVGSANAITSVVTTAPTVATGGSLVVSPSVAGQLNFTPANTLWSGLQGSAPSISTFSNDRNYANSTNGFGTGAETITTVAYAGGINLDWSLFTNFKVVLSGGTTIAFSNPPPVGKMQTLSIVIEQDGVGSRLVTWPATVRWSYGTAPVLTTTGNRRDIFTFTTFDAGTTYAGAWSMANVAIN